MLTDCDETIQNQLFNQQSILIYIQVFCFKMFPELRFVGETRDITLSDSDEN